VLAVGTRLFFEGGWALDPLQKLIQIDVDPEEMGKNFKVTVGIQSDARAGLELLISDLKGRTTRSCWKADELNRMRNTAQKESERMAPLQTKIIKTIRKALDEDAIVISDVTNIGHWSSVSFRVLKPRTYVTPSYFGTLGYAFPTALGAKIGNPDKQVVALCGDGGFMFTLQELATAVKEKISVTVIVFNDNAFGASLIEQLYNRRKRVIGTKLRNPDFANLARDFGAKGIRLSGPQHLSTALKESLMHRTGPTVIEVPVPTLRPPFLGARISK
jgi:acetolactate synthase-1/2/3 large subunit